MFKQRGLRSFLAVACGLLIFSTSHLVYGSNGQSITGGVQQLITMRQARNAQTQLQNLRMTATRQPAEPKVLKLMDRVRLNEFSKAGNNNRIQDQFKPRLRLHPNGPAFSAENGSNAVTESRTILMTVNGLPADTLEIGSNPYFEITLSDSVDLSITAMWDRDHNGFPSDGDIAVQSWQASDNDFRDENPADSVYGFTYSDEMADQLNRIADDWIFLAQSGDQFASVAVTFYQNETSFEITGTVTEQSTGNTLEGIIVWVDSAQPDYNGPNAIAITDTAGNYSLFVPDTGMYIVGSFDHLMVTDGLLPEPQFQQLMVFGPNTIADFTYHQPVSFISGLVTDDAGNPAVDVGIYASSDRVDLLVYTDSTGYYEIGVDPGHYWVGVDGESAFERYLLPAEREVFADEGGATHDIILYRPNDTISGQVVLNNAPWPGVMVFAWNDQVGAGVTFADSTGNFSIPVYSPVADGYYLDAKADVPIEGLVRLSEMNNVMPGATGQMLEYETVTGGLEGNIYDANTNEVLIDQVGMTAIDMVTGQQYNAFPNWDNGMYRLYLPDGDYMIWAGGQNYYPTPPDSAHIAGALIPHDFYLQPLEFNSVVEGHVYNAADNTPVPNADVWIGNEGNDRWGDHTFTDDSGFYYFDTPNGVFNISAEAPGFQRVGDQITVDNQTITYDFYLTPYQIGGSLSGYTYAADTSGTSLPLPYTNIHVYNDQFDFYGQSDNVGYYNMDLPQGLFGVEAFHDGYNPAFVDTIWVDGPTNLDLYLQHMQVNGAVWGHVYDAENNAPVPDAEVLLFIPEMPETPVGYQTWTDSSGDYWLDVQNGAYWLIVNHPDYQPYRNTNVTVMDDTVQVDVALQGFDGSIFGTVRDAETNDPIRNAWVFIQSTVDSTIQFFANTGEDGNYYAGVVNGSYDVTAGRDDYNAQTQFDIPVNDNDVQVDFNLGYHSWANPPEIMFVRDQPNDQGRWARMRFTSGGTDWGPYQGYSVWRMTQTPGGEIWDYLNYVAFHDQEAYNLVEPTLVDSNAYTGPTGNFWSTFVITGHADQWQFFDSAPRAGYSIDNIIPGVPQDLTVTNSTPQGVTVQWDASLDDDFQYFEVYRAETSDFNGVPPMLQTETTYTDENVELGHTYYYMVKAVDANGNQSNASNTVSSLVVSVENEAVVPTEYSLSQNYPNPFNPSTQIRFGLPEAGDVTLTIYNIRGQAVISLASGHFSAGYLTLTWDGKDAHGNLVSSGTYLYRINAGNYTATHKMVLMR